MFQLCPKLIDFWQPIFKFLSDLLEILREPLALIAIFGTVPQDLHLNQHSKNMTAFATLLARRVRLLKWKDRSPPTFNQWIRDLLHNLTLEKIHYATRGCAFNSDAIWQPVDQAEKIDASEIKPLLFFFLVPNLCFLCIYKPCITFIIELVMCRNVDLWWCSGVGLG